MMDKDQKIIFFDGTCNLCNGSVNFIIKRDKKKVFRFAPLQSEKAADILRGISDLPANLDSLVYVEGDKSYYKSRAVFKICDLLGTGCRILAFFGRIFPVVIADLIYDFLAKRRYVWFGRRPGCVVPARDVMDRFL